MNASKATRMDYNNEARAVFTHLTTLENASRQYRTEADESQADLLTFASEVRTLLDDAANLPRDRNLVKNLNIVVSAAIRAEAPVLDATALRGLPIERLALHDPSGELTVSYRPSSSSFRISAFEGADRVSFVVRADAGIRIYAFPTSENSNELSLASDRLAEFNGIKGGMLIFERDMLDVKGWAPSKFISEFLSFATRVVQQRRGFNKNTGQAFID